MEPTAPPITNGNSAVLARKNMYSIVLKGIKIAVTFVPTASAIQNPAKKKTK
jgi:hypothetical protein